MDKFTKMVKALPPGFIDTVKEMSREVIHTEIVQQEQELQRNAAAMAADEKLTAAKGMVRDLGGAYRDHKKNVSAKLAYLLHVLHEREYEAQVSADAAKAADASAEQSF